MKKTLWSLALLLGFGWIASPASAADFPGVKPEVIEKIKAALPEKGQVAAKKPHKVLIFSKTNGFRHGSIPVGAAALSLLGEKTGAYSAIHTEDDSYFEPEKLKEFDLVIMLNTTGDIFRPKDLPKEEPAKKAALERETKLKASLVEFVTSGKGLAGTHSATDTYHGWKEYNDMMGGTFDGHPWHQEVPVRLLAPDHPLNKVFHGQGFTITDEIYQFRDNTALPSDRKMLLALDTNFKDLGKGKHKDGFYAVSWIAKYGKGRTFYCSLGHRDEIYHTPMILEHYLAGFQYALGDLEADATPSEAKKADAPASAAPKK